MSVPDKFLNNSISISETLRRTTEENSKNFDESVFLGEIFEVIELQKVESVNRLCDTSLIQLKEIEDDFVTLLGGKDQYGMVKQKAEVIPVVSFFLNKGKAKKIENILLELKDELDKTVFTDSIMGTDSIVNMVDSILFPEKRYLKEKSERWPEFYFKNTPAMQAHVQIKNIEAKFSLIKAMLTRYLLSQKLREIQIENFKEVVEKEDTLQPELDRIKLVFRKGFYDEGVYAKEYSFNYNRLSQGRYPINDDGSFAAQKTSFRSFDIELDLSKFLNAEELPPLEEPKEEKPEREELFLMNPKTPNLYVDVINKIELEGDFDYDNIVIMPTHGNISAIKDNAFYYETSLAGYVHLKVFDKKSNKFMGVYSFPVEKIPVPSVKVSQNKGGKISIITLKRLEEVDLYFDDVDWLNALDFYTIKSFSFIKISKDGEVFYHKNKAAGFNDKIKNAVQSSLPGDKIILKDFKVIRHGKVTKLKPLVLEVI